MSGAGRSKSFSPDKGRHNPHLVALLQRLVGHQAPNFRATCSPAHAKNPTPSQELHSRDALAPVFADLNKYHATMHFLGQSTISSLTESHATGQAYCLAHHLTVDGDRRRLMIAALRYLDAFVKEGGGWRFAERRLYVDWLEERAL